MKSRIAASIAAAAVSASIISALAAAPASAAGINIGVAPSPNGYVMMGQPTQIAVSGTDKATVYMFNDSSGKYVRLGGVAKGAALPYTFPTNGIKKLKITPAKGKPKTFQVPVYARYSEGSRTPTNYAGLVLDSRTYGSAVTANASAGCVLADVGFNNNSSSIAKTVSVLSSGANAVAIAVEPKSSTHRSSVPVAGDAVVEVTPAKGSSDELGVVWTCVNAP